MNTTPLRELLDVYVRSWGPIDWSSLRNRTTLPRNPEFGRVLLALALIEGDSQVMRRKLSATHADRSAVLLEFIAIWLAEEGEHSRALKHMARLFGTTSLDCDRRRLTRDLRACITWPVLHAARLIPGLSATYCALGAMQESIALTTYHHLAALVDDEGCKEVLKRIAVQEAGHMRFYRHAAVVIWGTNDYLTSERSVELSSRFTRSAFNIDRIPGASHWLLDECPEKVSYLMSARLRGLTANQSAE